MKYTSEEMRIHAQEHLSKGITTPRFRRSSNYYEYPVLYAMCYAYDLKLSELAQIVGVCDSTPIRWIRGMYRPNQFRMFELTHLFNIPDEILFSSPKNASITCKERSKQYKRRNCTIVKYPVLYGLIKVYGYTLKEFCDEYQINENTMRGYVIQGKTPNKIEYIDKLTSIFGLERYVLFYKRDNGGLYVE